MHEPFAAGANVDLEIVDERGVVHGYRTMVYDESDDQLMLMAPLDGHVAIRLPAGLEINIMQEATQETYAAMVQILETRPGEPPLLITTRPQMVRKVSRRRFFRVDVDLPFATGDVSGRVVNLSGSGILALVPAGTVKEGALIEFRMELPNLLSPLPIQGKVARLKEVSGKAQIALQFTRLTERIRDEIIKYVTVRQRELLQLGLLVRPEE